MTGDLYREVKKILISSWDPLDIGDNPNLSDEYDAYVAAVIKLVKEGSSVQVIENYLRATEVTLGVQPPGFRSGETAKKLVEIEAN